MGRDTTDAVAGKKAEHGSSVKTSTPSAAHAADCGEAAASAVFVGEGCEEEGSSVETSASSPPHELPSNSTQGIANSASACRAPVGVFAPPVGETAPLSDSELRQKWNVAT